MPSSTSSERAGLLEALSEAVESGAGLPAVARAAARLLDASVALIDRSSAVLAVAGASSDQEQKLLSGGEGVIAVELRVADTTVGELRYRAKAAPDPVIARMVTTLLALELERSRSPEWESEEAAGAFVRAVLRREVTDRRDIVAQASELGADLDRGAGVVVLRAAPRAAQSGRVAGARPGPRAAGSAGAGPRLAGGQRRRRGRGGDRRRSSRPRTTSGSPAPPRGSRASSTTVSPASTSRSAAAAAAPTRSTSTAPVARRIWRSTSARPRVARCSPSRTPAPTGCCCRR